MNPPLSEDRIIQGVIKALEPKFEKIDKRFDVMDERFVAVDERFDQMDEQFIQVDKRFKQVDKQFDVLKGNISHLHSEGIDIKTRLISHEKTILDAIEGIAEQFTLKEETQKLEVRVSTLEHAQKTS